MDTSLHFGRSFLPLTLGQRSGKSQRILDDSNVVVKRSTKKKEELESQSLSVSSPGPPTVYTPTRVWYESECVMSLISVGSSCQGPSTPRTEPSPQGRTTHNVDDCCTK